MNLRIPTLSVLAGVGLLSACGGGGGLDEPKPGVPTIAQATTAASQAGALRTQAEARRAANLLLPLLSPNAVSATPAKAAGNREPGATEPGLQASGKVGAKAVTACQGGGTETDSQQLGVDVNSPYTEQTFDLDVLSYSACKTSEQTDTEVRVTGLNGVVRDGFVSTEDSDIVYVQRGESASQPLRISVQHQPLTGMSGPSFTVNTESFGVYHSEFGSSSVQRQRYYTNRGEVAGSEGGESFGGSFYIQQGSPANPMLVNTPQDGGLAHEGSVSVAILAKPAELTAACGNGSYQILNLVPLKDTDTSEGQLLQGQLQVKAGGQTATYLFTNDGNLEITAGDGSKATIRQADLIDECPILELF